MNIVRITFGQLNALPAGAFVSTLSGIFEHSPWVAEAALWMRPFTSIDHLHDAMATIALPAGAFVSTLSGIFEHSPWAAEAALRMRPFTSIDHLHDAMATIVDQAGEARQLALINAHPELAGKAAVRGELTDESTREQSGAGLDLCTQEEFDRLQVLNAAYREKFGFPFILAVRGFDRHGIIANFEARLHHGRDIELRESLQQIYRIARFRLDDLLDS